MIIGQVNPHTEAIIPVEIRDTYGIVSLHDAIIDTGFSGYLTLPSAVISGMRLPFVSSELYSLGNNAQVTFKLYSCTILWDGKERDIDVLASDTQPLAGMSLLKGFHISIDAVDGGEVRIEPRA